MPDADTKPIDFPLPRTCPTQPPPMYAKLREGPPRKVRLPDGTPAWILTRYEDVRDAMGHPLVSIDEANPHMPHRLLVPRIPKLFSFIRMDDPEHARLRKMVTAEFTVRSVKAMRPVIQRLVDELLDEMAAMERPVDIVSAFAIPLPCLVIARIFGIPDEDIRTLKEQTTAGLSQDVTPEQAMAAAVDMTQYLDRLTASKERQPTDDLMGRLARDYVNTGKLSHDDMVGMIRLILVAGHETTANHLGLSVFTLLQHPGQLAEMKADPSLMNSGIDELLRFWSISQDNIVRVAGADLEIGGVRIAKNDGIVLAIPAANHDESVFPDAATFDIHRDARHHLTFGHGPHYCIGATLAVSETQIALRTLFDRFPALRLAVEPDDLPFRYTSLVYGLHKLPVTW